MRSGAKSDNLSGVKVALVLVLVVLAAGCVERRLFVRSDPPGARVFLDGKPAGETPVAIPFTYYGTREVVLRAPGREPKRVVVDLDPPWYQWTPIDFFVEVAWPFTVTDERRVDATLAPAPVAGEKDVEALRARAEAARAGGELGLGGK
jgi:hypothetical protein